MIGEVIVMEPAAYQAWLERRRSTGTLASNGQQLFQQLGCVDLPSFRYPGTRSEPAGRFRQAGAAG